MEVRYFTKALLAQANALAIRRNYNRSLKPSFVRSLPSGVKMPITLTIPHEHAAGVRVAPHVRCGIIFNEKGARIFIDCAREIFDQLPTVVVNDEIVAANQLPL